MTVFFFNLFFREMKWKNTQFCNKYVPIFNCIFQRQLFNGCLTMQRETEAWQIPPLPPEESIFVVSYLQYQNNWHFGKSTTQNFALHLFLQRIPPDCNSRQIQGYFSTVVFERSFIIKWLCCSISIFIDGYRIPFSPIFYFPKVLMIHKPINMG